MASKQAKVWKALKTYLEAYQSLPLVAYGGQSFTPPSDGGVYFIVDDLRFGSDRKYQNTSAPTWQTGSLVVHCMVPLEWDDLQSAEYAGQVADYFAQDTAMTFDGVTIKVSRQPTVEGVGMRDGDMFRIPILIPWEGWV